MLHKNKQKDFEKNDKYQAFILTDSYQKQYTPISYNTPVCLLPLANVPLIEYTLEFLATANISEVFLICTSHANKIHEYIKSSQWNSETTPFRIVIINMLQALSVGDVMRDLDRKGLINSDFVLISGNVVTNIDLDSAMSFHKAKKKQDRNHVFTMVLFKTLLSHNNSKLSKKPIFLLNKDTNECLQYCDINFRNKKQPFLISSELFDSTKNDIVVRTDLRNCCIDICSPNVPQIFQENFDYQSLRDHFVKGVLSSDLIKKTIYTYIVENRTHYARSVESWFDFSTVSLDIVSRWTYPFVPDSFRLNSDFYTYEINHIYKGRDLKLAQSCRIGECTIIGSNTSIETNSFIYKSVIGKNCKIGKNVFIKNSFIWDNTFIGDNSKICFSLLASNVKIGNNVTIDSNVFIDFNVVVHDNKKIKSNTKISNRFIDNRRIHHSSDEFNSYSENDSETDSCSNANMSPNNVHKDLVGENGFGFLYLSDEETSDFKSNVLNYNDYTELDSDLESLKISNDSEDKKSSKEKTLKKVNHRSLSFSSKFSEDESFNKEAIATIQRALLNNYDLDVVSLELNTLRMSINASYHEVRLATFEALIEKINDLITVKLQSPTDATNVVLKHWGKLFKNQVLNHYEEIDLLNIVQYNVNKLDINHNQLVLFLCVKNLYDLDIVEEKSIILWWEDDNFENLNEIKILRELTSNFVHWLLVADEEE